MGNHFITNINIKKLRHLENINIDLDKENKKHLILTGKNGAGKTTTLLALKDDLRAIQEGLSSFVKMRKEDLNRLKNQLNKASSDDEIKKLEASIEGCSNDIRRHSCIELDLEFNTDVSELDNVYKLGNFILAYYGSNRQIKVETPKGVEKIELKLRYSIEDKPSSIFVKYLVDLKTQQSFARNENENDVVENIEEWFKRLEKALGLILDDKSVKLKFDYRNYNFKICQEGREPFSFNDLSDGYSSILSILSDLILRMDKERASREKNYAFDLEGIVLIDEIETHLHIELQKVILPFLSEFFPNLQFIVTTHSPFVLSSVNNAVIYDLEKNLRIENLSNYSYEGIVECYFEVDNYSEELKKKIEEYRELVFKNNLSDDERARRAELRIELKNAANDLAGEVKAEFNRIELERKSYND